MTNPSPIDYSKDIAAVSRIEAVQRILEVVCRVTNLGFAAVARVTESRWICCAVRDEIAFNMLPGDELKIESTICNDIRGSGKLVAIDHVERDALFCDHHTPKLYGFQSYISVPITLGNGKFFGTLCALDPRPTVVNTPQIIGMFRLFTDLIAMHLDAQDRIDHANRALLDERERSQLREQFIAVLGHDLRNPLSAIGASVQVLQMMEHEPDAAEYLTTIKRSVARMAGLIDNVLDFARGRLGGGFAVAMDRTPKLQGAIEHAIAEIRTAAPTVNIISDVRIEKLCRCDSGKIAQLVSNLLGNAVNYGDTKQPIHLRAVTSDETLSLSVTNYGQTIPPDIRERLFEPFSRGIARPGQDGLGLGLYIASEIARAHGGTLTAVSENGETTFTFEMPL